MIVKYSLPLARGRFFTPVHENLFHGHILDCQVQTKWISGISHTAIAIWADVAEVESRLIRDRVFVVCSTGDESPPKVYFDYLGTVQNTTEELVYHVYMRKP